ncbi:MAG: PepSY domain-containing protein [Methanoregula sp.]|nr:PepSY domain-containing protein [Methanoregula sp.]
MTTTRWKILPLVLLCMIVCVPAVMAKEITMAPAGSLAGAASVHDNYPISEERAMLFVKDFVGDFDMDLVPDDVESLPIGNYYTFYSNDDRFWVNQQSGDVEFAHFNSNYQNCQSNDGNCIAINQTRDQAYTAAQAYAIEKYEGFNEKHWLLIEDTLINSTAGSEYSFMWREYIGTDRWYGTTKEVTLPNIVHVSVSASDGKVIDYWGVNRLLSASTTPQISMSEAMETAEDSVPGDIDISNPKISLTLAERTQNVETLVWIVTFDGTRGDEKIPVTIYVNANNGRIIKDLLWAESWLE